MEWMELMWIIIWGLLLFAVAFTLYRFVTYRGYQPKGDGKIGTPPKESGVPGKPLKDWQAIDCCHEFIMPGDIDPTWWKKQVGYIKDTKLRTSKERIQHSWPLKKPHRGFFYHPDDCKEHYYVPLGSGGFCIHCGQSVSKAGPPPLPDPDPEGFITLEKKPY